MERIKYLALDMDGTTLRSDLTISEKDLESLHKAIDNGIQIIVASGRPYTNLLPEIQNLPCDYSIQRNGALVIDWKNNHQAILRNEINTNDAYAVLKELMKKDIFISCSSVDDVFVYEGTAKKYWERVSTAKKRDPKYIYEDVAEAVLKANASLENIWIYALSQKGMDETLSLQKDFPNLNIERTNVHDIAVTHRNATKANALKWLLNYLNVDCCHLAAMGDSDNDIGMMELASVCFTPNNCTDNVRKVADYVLSSHDENAVSEAIDMILEWNKNCK